MNTEQKAGKVLGELESEIMEVVWNYSGSISVREVTDILKKKRKIAYTTIMTIMGRLTEKGLLKKTSSGKAYAYKSAYSKDTFLTRVSREIIKNLTASFGDMAIASFAESIDKLPEKKRKYFLEILEEYDKNK